LLDRRSASLDEISLPGSTLRPPPSGKLVGQAFAGLGKAGADAANRWRQH